MRRFIEVFAFVFATLSWPAAASATPARLDDETCNQLRLEQIKFKQLGVVSDIEKGGTWGKANLSAERLREIEQYIQLDEQVKFGCRDAKLTLDGARASEAARRLELNPDLDPTAPLPASADPANPNLANPNPAAPGAASPGANGSSDDGASGVKSGVKRETKPVVRSDRPVKPAAKPKPAAAKPRPPKADDAYAAPAGAESVLVPPKGTPALVP